MGGFFVFPLSFVAKSVDSNTAPTYRAAAFFAQIQDSRRLKAVGPNWLDAPGFESFEATNKE